MNESPSPALRRLAAFSLFALLLLCVAWEAWLAPLRPGGSWMILKAVPLALPLRKILQGNLYTFQWTSMLSLLYVAEGAVRAFSDVSARSAMLGGVELVLALTLFISAILYVRPAKRAARRLRVAKKRIPS